MDKIIVKEIGVYVNKRYPKKTISEYLIYLCIGEVKVSAYNVFGEQAKNEKVDALLVEHFMGDSNTIIEKDKIIEVIPLNTKKIMSNG